MYSQSVYQSLQVPGHKYEIEKADKLIRPREKFVKMIKLNDQQIKIHKERFLNIKSKDPDMGSYD
jgi:hypothetical protein